MERLRGVEMFVRAVEAGSLEGAAQRLVVTPAALAQGIARLEDQLGRRLLRRTTRSLALTDAGKAYFNQVKGLVDSLDEATDAACKAPGAPRGQLLVAVSAAFGRHVIAPLLADFMSTYPDLAIELVLMDRGGFRSGERFDVTICVESQLQPAWAARQIATVAEVFCASPNYLFTWGRPKTPDDLSQHRCLRWRSSANGKVAPWTLRRGGRLLDMPAGAATVSNDADALFHMALAGAGIARLSSFVANSWIEAGRLEPVLTEYAPEPLNLYACVMDRSHLSAKSSAFIDFLTDKLHAPGAPQITQIASRKLVKMQQPIIEKISTTPPVPEKRKKHVHPLAG